jgi:ribonuclease E
VDEQILKGLDRRVFLPSGGHLVIDRTEAMTVVDVNTGKYTGTGGNLEETVTRNNLEAAEEIVRQLRLRDLGGIIVIDFIDMVLESNRDLVLRRLTECLGRDRTKHQVTEITSLGLVQMTRKRVGQGLLEAFSENCEVCKGRGLIIHHEPIPERRGSGGGPAPAKAAPAKAEEPSENGRGGRRRRRGAAAAEPAPAGEFDTEATVEPGAPIEAGAALDSQADAADDVIDVTADDDLDGHEAAFAGLDPVPAVGFDEDGLDAEDEPVPARRRGRRRRG